MGQYIEKFKTRWTDIDANRHLANTAYSELMINVRTSFFKNTFAGKDFQTLTAGPVLLYEKIYYQKEILPFEEVYVDFDILGASEDYMFVEFSHTMYNSKGDVAAFAEIMCAWLDFQKRKLSPPSPELLSALKALQGDKKIRRIEQKETRYKNIPTEKLNVQIL